MALTKAEKAARYDALQAAIRFTTENYRRRRTECMQRYQSYGADTGLLGCYNKGLSDAFDTMIEQLERWLDP